MEWQRAAEAIGLIEEKDISAFSLSVEEGEEICTLFNRSVSNAQNGGADISLIALKKILTRYPNWGEAVLLYGICLALEGSFVRARASFEHVLQIGFLSIDYRQAAEYCFQMAEAELHKSKKHLEQEAETEKKITSFFQKKKEASIYSAKNGGESIPMQTPILTRAPKNAGKARFATDKERRNVLLSGNMPESDMPEEEIDVSIPKTPAEKMRRVSLVFVVLAVLVAIGCAIWFFLVPAIQSMGSKNQSDEKLSYILQLLEEKKEDAEVSSIVEAYESRFETLD